MKWQQFLKLAYPEDLKKEDDQERTIIYKWHRWIGLFLGYLVYHLGISANFIGISRIFIALVSLYLISFVKEGKVLIPFIGLFLLYGQHILDKVDGVIARARGTVNELGAKLDGIGNSFSRFAILVLLAAFTEKIAFILFAVLVSYVLVRVRDEFIRANLAYDTRFKGFAIFFRVIFSIQVMLFILPLLIVLINVFNWEIVTFSYIVISFYAITTAFWFLLSFWKYGRILRSKKTLE